MDAAQVPGAVDLLSWALRDSSRGFVCYVSGCACTQACVCGVCVKCLPLLLSILLFEAGSLTKPRDSPSQFWDQRETTCSKVFERRMESVAIDLYHKRLKET